MAASADISQIWDDLLNWQKEINKKDESLSKRKLVHDQVLPPVREPAVLQLDELKPVGLQKVYSKQKPATAKTKSAAGNKPGIMSRAEKAEAEKAKGNEYFVKKDYKNAILHYGKAIEMNPTKAVYFVNRAMAHLKVNNFLEAERDCTRGIQLQPDNVKAYWRRGIALKELGRINEAKKDFESALKIEPTNTAVLEELNKLPKLKQAFTNAQRGPDVKPAAKPQKDAAPVEPKRRLPIDVLDEEYIDSSKLQEGVSTQNSISNEAKKTGADKMPSKTSSEPEQRQQQSKSQTLNTNKTVEKGTSPSTTSPPSASKPKPVAVPLTFKCPKTNFDFERDWKTYKARGDDILYQYFQVIPPSSYADIFKSSLESDQFEKMIELLEANHTKTKTPQNVFDVLKGLSKVKRIDMLVMFLGKKHQQALRSLFATLRNCQDLDKDDITKLSKIYSIA